MRCNGQELCAFSRTGFESLVLENVLTCILIAYPAVWRLPPQYISFPIEFDARLIGCYYSPNPFQN